MNHGTHHGVHHNNMSGNHHYASDPAHAQHHGHSHGHMPHSSVSSAASAPYPFTYAHHVGMPAMQPFTSAVQVPVPAAFSNYMTMPAMHPSMSQPATTAAPLTSHVAEHAGPMPNLTEIGPPSHDTEPAENRRPDTVYDPTGQKQPPGIKPKVTATLWEDEGSLCFQVEAQGVCVARREDNHMINGTKLLNVAGMTRGRRDGILKSEKTRNVVKIGPMHLKGVWVPFERALDFANKEKITDSLYPLFVHNIGALLYHPPPAGQPRMSIGAGSVIPEDRRVEDATAARDHSTTRVGTLQHHQPGEQSMSAGESVQASQAPASHHGPGRPEISRAHTFHAATTTAPTMMGLGTTGGYEWNGTPATTASPAQSISVDTGLSTTRAPYETTRAYSHSAHPSFSSSYSNGPRFGQMQSSPLASRNMGPPARLHHDVEEHPSSDADHDGDYTHAAGNYNQHRAYAYGAQAQHHESHVSPEMTHSPRKHAGGATPRSATTYGGYAAPQPNNQRQAMSMYAQYGDHSRMLNGHDMYGSEYAGMRQSSAPMTSPATTSTNKRPSDDDEHEQSYKRQRTNHDDPTALRPMISAQSQKR